MSTYALSDVHGCLDELQAMLKKIEFSDYDELWIVGDLCDRGRQSMGVLKFVMAHPNIHVILGNHDLWLKRYIPLLIEGKKDPAAVFRGNSDDFVTWLYFNGGQTTMNQFLDEELPVCYDMEVYIDKCPLYQELTLMGEKFLLVHAGLGPHPAPGIRPSELSEYDLVWPHIGLDDNPSQDTIMIVGHLPTFLYGEEYDGKIAHGAHDTLYHIDTGCVYGRTLSCLRLEDKAEFYVPSSYPYLGRKRGGE
jgi:serine/threonine protein phosphatase 1